MIKDENYFKNKFLEDIKTASENIKFLLDNKIINNTVEEIYDLRKAIHDIQLKIKWQ